MRFAMKSTPSLMLDCAQHFEEKGEYDKAVQLYHKGGDYPKALDLCFRVGELDPSQSKTMFDMMNLIAQDLGSDTSPQTLARCAQFLVNHKQYDKAIELYVLANRPLQAIEMCITQKITMNEDLVAKLTPAEPTDATSPADANERKEILKELARALKRQGSYLLASRKYTQAGDRIRAIKCLVKSGDTKAVIQFASISRNAEIYTLAANYLQQMNWRESVDIMKSIIMFYTKAKAWEQLARFYDSCALVEIDEYRDYEKAIEALKESLKYMNKIENPNRNQVDLQDSIDKRIVLTEKFIHGRDAIASDKADLGISILQELLNEPLVEEAVRSGDCYAMIVEHLYQAGAMKDAFNYLLEMEDRRIPLNPYLETEVIEAIFRANGRNPRQSPRANTRDADVAQSHHRHDDEAAADEDEEEIDEEIAEVNI
jgi:intraflagellar transport protein 140